MISLIEDDHPDYMHLGPWLASAFVLPDMRGKGLFKSLHDVVVNYAASEMKLAQLYVYSHMDFRKWGWTAMERISDPFAPDKQVTLFRLTPTPST